MSEVSTFFDVSSFLLLLSLLLFSVVYCTHERTTNALTDEAREFGDKTRIPVVENV